MKFKRYMFVIATTFILLNGCGVKPPHETGNFKQTDLVELINSIHRFISIFVMQRVTILLADLYIKKHELFYKDLPQKH